MRQGIQHLHKACMFRRGQCLWRDSCLTTRSISSVVTPGQTAACALSSTSRASLHAARRPSISCALLTGTVRSQQIPQLLLQGPASRAAKAKRNLGMQRVFHLCAAVCSQARWSGSLSPHSQGAGCLQGPATHAAQPGRTSKQHCSGKQEQAHTGRRGAMGVGRKGPVHLNSGMIVLRALPRCVQNSQDSGPGLCARLCSGQACCTRKHTGCLAGLQDGNRLCAAQQGQAAQPGRRACCRQKRGQARCES